MIKTENREKVEILIGDKSCRGCRLCVDICPTKVFDFDEKEQKAIVKTAGDCIQCMTCQYVCPSNCITQNGLTYSKNFSRNEEYFKTATKYLFPLTGNFQLSEEDYKLAEADLMIRMSSLGKTFESMVGASAPTVATTAGRAAAWHIPGMYDDKINNLSSLLDYFKKSFHPAWEIDVTVNGESEAKITIKACPVRDVCNKTETKIGGLICELFKSYLNGLIVEILKKRPMMKIESTGQDQCQYALKMAE